MQCLPGEPGVADPTWRKYLHWPTTKPFKIRWITKCDSSYRVAGNLRNPLNDDSMVFVGRDGQRSRIVLASSCARLWTKMLNTRLTSLTTELYTYFWV